MIGIRSWRQPKRAWRKDQGELAPLALLELALPDRVEEVLPDQVGEDPDGRRTDDLAKAGARESRRRLATNQRLVKRVRQWVQICERILANPIHLPPSALRCPRRANPGRRRTEKNTQLENG